MHVADTVLTRETHELGGWFSARATATVKIVDSSDLPVVGAAVYGSWSGFYARDISGTTDTEGLVGSRTGRQRTQDLRVLRDQRAQGRLDLRRGKQRRDLRQRGYVMAPPFLFCFVR